MRVFPEIVQRDDGAWSIGWQADAPGPFPSRQHAEAVARQSGDKAASHGGAFEQAERRRLVD
jgi:hypothetical protein